MPAALRRHEPPSPQIPDISVQKCSVQISVSAELDTPQASLDRYADEGFEEGFRGGSEEGFEKPVRETLRGAQHPPRAKTPVDKPAWSRPQLSVCRGFRDVV